MEIINYYNGFDIISLINKITATANAHVKGDEENLIQLLTAGR